MSAEVPGWSVAIDLRRRSQIREQWRLGCSDRSRKRVGSRTAGESWLAELVASMYGSDYAIWEPKWQIEGFLNWNYPDDVAYSDYPAVTDATKRKILGLNAAKLYGIEVPRELQLPAEEGTPAAREDAQLVESG
jgi:hypothetical protein